MKHDLFTLRIEPSEHGMIGNSTVSCRRCMKDWLVIDNEFPPPKFLEEECPAAAHIRVWQRQGNRGTVLTERWVKAEGHETIAKFIQQKFVLSAGQLSDGRVQADMVRQSENHHAQGPTLEIALTRLESYLASVDLVKP